MPAGHSVAAGEARDLLVDALAYATAMGLLSEDIDPKTGTLWGNFPGDRGRRGKQIFPLAAIVKKKGNPLSSVDVTALAASAAGVLLAQITAT